MILVKNIIKLFSVIAGTIFLQIICACDPHYLDIKPDKSLLIPTTLENFEAIIQNEIILITKAPALSILSSDDVFISDDMLKATNLTLVERNVYRWEKDLFEGEKYVADWSAPYESIFYANVVLNGLEKILKNKENEARWNKIYGMALFYRAVGHYNLAKNFCEIYDSKTAESNLGIPLKLSSDINERPNRGTLKETYDRIINDLISSLSYLPDAVERKSQPDKTAVKAMLSRIYLAMGNYEDAFKYAQDVLEVNSSLIDYNTLDQTLAKPFPESFPNNKNIEVLYFSQINSWAFRTVATVNPELYDIYQVNDIRKNIYFKNQGNGYYSFVGTYNKTVLYFEGITTAEILLNRAECAVRLGKIEECRKDLQKLLDCRYIRNFSPDVSLINKENLLASVLTERRRELAFRNLRWMDLKRLNLSIETQTKITRIIDNKTHTLEPMSPLYVFPIPRSIELDFNNLPQNIR